MIALLVGLALIGVGFAALALQRFYSSVPLRELKRLASRQDELATRLYRAATFGPSLRTLLWSIAALSIGSGLVLLTESLTVGPAIAIVVVVLAIAFVIIPSLRLSVHSAQFAAALAPVFAALLRQLHVPLAAIARLINKGRDLYMHSRLYEKEDLTDLLHRQKEQVDNRISLEELELAQRALQFSDRKAIDIVQPRKETYLVSADDSIGPILLAELYKSGQSSFLVYKDQQENVVGSLLMRDAVNAKQGGRVFDLIRSDLCFVREDFSLRQVLLAFQKTGHHTALVINNFEEFLGIITLDKLLEALVGETADVPENYENRAAIAQYRPSTEVGQDASLAAAAARDEDQQTEPASPEATEVVK